MIKFDKLKIITNINNIKKIDETVFEIISKEGIKSEYKYSRKTPSELLIKMDIQRRELVIEFTGKILNENYPQLINKDSIRKCFENINTLGLCELNIDSILSDSTVVKADVTKDVTCDNIKQLTTQLKTNIRNYSKYVCRNIKGNLVIEKNVVTNSHKLRLTVYDKEKEMAKNRNECFDEKIKAQFKNIIRFELNINTQKQLRKNLEITDTKLDTILCAPANPIWNFLDKILIDEIEITPKTVKKMHDFERLEVLRRYNYDLEEIESIVRMCSSPKSHITQMMKPYRDLVSEVKNYSNNTFRNEMQTLLN